MEQFEAVQPRTQEPGGAAAMAHSAATTGSGMFFIFLTQLVSSTESRCVEGRFFVAEELVTVGFLGSVEGFPH